MSGYFGYVYKNFQKGNWKFKIRGRNFGIIAFYLMDCKYDN